MAKCGNRNTFRIKRRTKEVAMNAIKKAKEWLNAGNNSLWVATAAMMAMPKPVPSSWIL